MATTIKYSAVMVKFGDCGVTGAPLIPVSGTTEGTASAVATAVKTAISGLTGAGTMTDGECYQVIIKAKEVEE